MAILCFMLMADVRAQTISEITISLPRPMHFTSPDETDVMLPAGTYAVHQAGERVLVLSSEGASHSIEATGMTHQELLVTPLTLSVPEPDGTQHVLLLFPNGTGLNATGSPTAIRSRGPAAVPLSDARLHDAVITGPIRAATPALPPSRVQMPQPFCKRSNGQPDMNPDLWQKEVENRKLEYQVATINEELMGNTKLELMKGQPPFPSDAPFRKLPPDLRDDNGRLASRLSLSARARREALGVNVWPWQLGWNDERFKAWRTAHPSDDPIKTWWYAQLLRVKDGKSADELVILDNNADFQANERIRDLYLLPPPNADPNFPEEVRVAFERSFQHFKYWLDEPWSDNKDGEMTYWSENHQILFASVEFLAGQYMRDRHPNWIFRDGTTGAQHMEKVRPRLLRWLDERLRYGFNEWNSPSYYNFDIFPLLNLVDFVDVSTEADRAIQIRATMVLDLIFFDLARLTQKGNFGATAGRAYPEAKITGWDQSVGDLVQIMFGTRCPNNPIYGRDFGNRYWSGNADSAHAFASSTQYQVPMAVLAVGHGWNLPYPYQERARVSVNFEEAENYGTMFDNFDDIMFWWGRGAYFSKYTVRTSLDLIKAAHLETQHDFKDYSQMMSIGGKVLDPTGGRLTLEDVVDGLSFVTEGMALTRGNLYTYKNGDVMLSSVQNFRKGEMGPQLQAWQVTFDNDVVVFGTYPTVQYGEKASEEYNGPEDGGSHDGPNWWAGNAVNPRVVQYEDALIAAYAADQPSRLLRNAIKKDKLGFDPQTHLWWPWNAKVWPMSKKEPFRVRHFFEDTYVEHAGPPHFDPLLQYGNRTFVEERVSTADGGGGAWYFAKRGNGYVGVFSAQICQATAGDWAGKELLCPNYRNVFIVQVGNAGKFGSFADFVRIVKDSRINISKGVRKPATDTFGLSDVEASYDLPWKPDPSQPGGWKRRRLELHYDQESPRLDGAPYCDDEFPRYESPFIAHAPDKAAGTVAWGQRQYTIQHGPYKLCHNQATGERSETCP
jgi:hypothetical protein